MDLTSDISQCHLPSVIQTSQSSSKDLKYGGGTAWIYRASCARNALNIGSSKSRFSSRAISALQRISLELPTYVNDPDRTSIESTYLTSPRKPDAKTFVKCFALSPRHRNLQWRKAILLGVVLPKQWHPLLRTSRIFWTRTSPRSENPDLKIKFNPSIGVWKHIRIRQNEIVDSELETPKE